MLAYVEQCLCLQEIHTRVFRTDWASYYQLTLSKFRRKRKDVCTVLATILSA